MDFEKARFNMVEQQIRPWDVLDFDILDALEEIGREHFVGEAFQGLAYADMELPLANGHKMLEPKVVARLAQGLKLKKRRNCLRNRYRLRLCNRPAIQTGRQSRH